MILTERVNLVYKVDGRPIEKKWELFPEQLLPRIPISVYITTTDKKFNELMWVQDSVVFLIIKSDKGNEQFKCRFKYRSEEEAKKCAKEIKIDEKVLDLTYDRIRISSGKIPLDSELIAKGNCLSIDWEDPDFELLIEPVEVEFSRVNELKEYIERNTYDAHNPECENRKEDCLEITDAISLLQPSIKVLYMLCDMENLYKRQIEHIDYACDLYTEVIDLLQKIDVDELYEERISLYRFVELQSMIITEMLKKLQEIKTKKGG